MLIGKQFLLSQNLQLSEWRFENVNAWAFVLNIDKIFVLQA